MKTPSAKSYQTEQELIPSGLWQTARFALEHYGWLGTAARFLLLRDELRKFVRRGASDAERRQRRELLAGFQRIQAAVPCGHSPFQFVLIAEMVLGLPVAGPLVECGCYKGGGSAKLSLLARATGRRLYVCDSFEGLPEPRDRGEALLEGHGDTFNVEFRAGQYRGELEEVEANVRRYGAIDVCEFRPGYFDRSLQALDVRPALVFIDVDLVSSARDCLLHLWPRLVPGGYWLTHEASFPRYIEGLQDARWWQEHLGEAPPPILGAGCGLSPLATSLAYFRKPEVPP
jgi:hypothetical protein